MTEEENNRLGEEPSLDGALKIILAGIQGGKSQCPERGACQYETGLCEPGHESCPPKYFPQIKLARID